MKTQLYSKHLVLSATLLAVLLVGCSDKPKFKPGYSDATQLDPAQLKKEAETKAAKAKEDKEKTEAAAKDAEINKRIEAKIQEEFKKRDEENAKKQAEADAKKGASGVLTPPAVNPPVVNPPTVVNPPEEVKPAQPAPVVANPVVTPKPADPIPAVPEHEDEIEVDTGAGAVVAPKPAPVPAPAPAPADELEVEAGEGNLPVESPVSILENPKSQKLSLKLNVSSNQTTSLIVSCGEKAETAKTEAADLVLLSGSTLVMASVNEKGEDLSKKANCFADKKEMDLKKASESIGLVQILKQGQTSTLNVQIADGDKKSLSTVEVSCQKDESSIEKNLRGIALLTGSRLLVRSSADASSDKVNQVVVGCE